MKMTSPGLAQNVIEKAIAFVRTNGVLMRCIDISRRKAYATICKPTDEFLARLRKDHVEARDFGDEMLCALSGETTSRMWLTPLTMR